MLQANVIILENLIKYKYSNAFLMPIDVISESDYYDVSTLGDAHKSTIHFFAII